MQKVVIIGAGIGGLVTAAALAKQGIAVTVLEAHVYPGGSAGTFFHQGYRFDAGATLAAGFYPGGPWDRVGHAVGISEWPVKPDPLAMVVHLPDGVSISRWGDERRFAEYQKAFGSQGLSFFSWQERTADFLWDFALLQPPWPPQTPMDFWRLSRKTTLFLFRNGSNGHFYQWKFLPSLMQDAFRPIAEHLRTASETLRLFVDSQLLISAQTASTQANALYGAAALDLPRRGVAHLMGGMGAIAETLVQAIRHHGGEVLYRQEVLSVRKNGHSWVVETKRGGMWQAGIVIFNLPPWNIARILGEQSPLRLRRLSPRPTAGWGAFMAYVGIDGGILPGNFPLHHQVVEGRPLGEGRSIFISISPPWDNQRAPMGKRAVTISTHTRIEPWWDLHNNDPLGYESYKRRYLERVLRVANRVMPGIQEACEIVLPATPVTFERYTRRAFGWVGGFPQDSLFRSWGPRLGDTLWMVGDSIFPGQSIAATALGGLRVAEEVRRALDRL